MFISCSLKFSAGTTQKGVFHLLSNCWTFRKLFLNGKQPKTSCEVSVHLATRKEKAAQAIQGIAKCAIVPAQMHCLYFWNSLHPVLVSGYEGISMTKFNNLKVKRVKSNLKYTESKLVKNDHGKRKKYWKSHYHIGITQKGITQKGTTLKGITQKGITQIGITQNGMKQKGNMQNPGVSLRVFWAKHHYIQP